MNENLAKMFDAMARQNKGDRYRKRAYSNAASQIRAYPGQIKSGMQARRDIKGIGESIAAKIDEILESGTLKQIEAVSQSAKEKDKILATFEGIYGVGIKIAEQWYAEGYRDLHSLIKKYPEMTPAQQLGYKYYNDLQKKIPRNEIDYVNEILEKTWKNLNIQFTIAGSYRRGEPESSDIDIIVKGLGFGDRNRQPNIKDMGFGDRNRQPNIKDMGFGDRNRQTNIKDGIQMEELLIPLRKYIIGNLTKITGKSWFGLVKFKDTVRRMDILLVEPEEYPYTLIYFTGNLELNVQLRTLASKRDYKLTGHELLDPKGRRVFLPDEKSIFDFFNLKYIPPEQRKGNFVLEQRKGNFVLEQRKGNFVLEEKKEKKEKKEEKEEEKEKKFLKLRDG
jgi:DNA polymerase IV